MVAWGPVTCSVGPGVVHAEDLACTLYDSGPVAGTVIRQVTGDLTWTWSGGRTDAAVAVRVLTTDVNGVQIDNAQVSFWRVGQSSGSFTYLTPITTNRFRVEWHHSAYVGQSSIATAHGTFDQTVYCPFGTQVKQGIAGVVYITPDLLQLMVQFVEAPWLAVPLAIFAFTTLAVTNLCSGPPRQIPAITAESTGLGIDYWRQVLESIAWAYFCECVPGGGTAPPYPVPKPIQPPDWPTSPFFTCSPDDLCSSIVEIKKQLASIAQSLSSVREVTTLVQRYRAPFAYIRGARHPNLAGSGAFTVPRLVGVLVDVISRPASLQTFTGEPPYVADLGWLSVWSSDGLVEEIRLTRDLQVWLPAAMTAAASFHYALRGDVVIGVTELEAEV